MRQLLCKRWYAAALASTLRSPLVAHCLANGWFEPAGQPHRLATAGQLHVDLPGSSCPIRASTVKMLMMETANRTLMIITMKSEGVFVVVAAQ